MDGDRIAGPEIAQRASFEDVTMPLIQAVQQMRIRPNKPRISTAAQEMDGIIHIVTLMEDFAEPARRVVRDAEGRGWWTKKVDMMPDREMPETQEIGEMFKNLLYFLTILCFVKCLNDRLIFLGM
ncbi:hypothetical protein A0U87_13445 [Sphingobium sp. MP9-4]|nr:hypothetical protein A0U87_13445 [Sphingobium sp. MP9-4]